MVAGEGNRRGRSSDSRAPRPRSLACLPPTDRIADEWRNGYPYAVSKLLFLGMWLVRCRILG